MLDFHNLFEYNIHMMNIVAAKEKSLSKEVR